MKRVSFMLLLCASFLATHSHAQESKPDSIGVVAGIVNNITYRPIVDADAYLLRPDSSVVDSMKTFESESDIGVIGTVYFESVKSGERYILCVRHPRYETLYIPFTAEKKKTDEFCLVGDKDGRTKMRLKPMTRELGAAVVKATRVKFYNKGDTIVYNADAFQLEHGSMLDAIIRQMPGVELKDDGEITVNGRRVDELLLNGKDFFSHDRQIMLDNLPAYMVKNIKVYERQSDRSKFFGENLDSRKPYVMDVGLKREYSVGVVGNAEVAGGTEDRYLARLFALRFTPQSRLSFYGLANNLNDSRRPGQNGDWSPTAAAGSGLVATRKGAIDYSVDDKRGAYSLRGGAEMSRQDADTRTFSNSATFLSGGDTYGLSRNSSRSYNTSFYTEHTFTLSKGLFATLTPVFSYHNTRNRSLALASALDRNVYRHGRETLDSIFAPAAAESIRRILINRSRQMGLGRSHGYTASGSGQVAGRVEALSLFTSLSFGGSYSDGKGRAFNLQKTDFFKEAGDGIFRNQYRETPNNAYSYNVEWTNMFKVAPSTWIVPEYAYSQSYNSARRDLFSFDSLGDETLLPFGSLPSTADSMEMARSARDSYNSARMSNRHRAQLSFQYKDADSKPTGHSWDADISFPVNFKRNNIRYARDGKRADVSRHFVAFEPNLNIQHYNRKNDSVRGNREIHDDIRIGTSSSMADVLYFVPWYKDETDPMNTFAGNTGLKNPRVYNASYQRLYTNFATEVNWHYDINYSITHNAVAVGREFDRSTGIRNARPDNVNGNWSVFGGAYYYTPLDKRKRWSFNTFTVANYTNSVDLAGSDDRGVYRSDVHNLRLSESVNLALKLKKMRITAVGSVDWLNATSRRDGFKTVNVENFKYGVNWNCNLPLGFDVSTDLMMYSRRGYDDKGMNGDDLVWNARVSKNIIGSSLVLSAEGFDILHNLSSVTRSLNAQGRVETYSNVIPRYFMLHLTYRLNIKPKKRPGDE